MTKIAINGFGRIGRSAFKIALDKFSQEIEVVAINDLADNATLAHLLKYDSNYGVWPRKVSVSEDSIEVDGKKIKALAEKEPQKLPWNELGVDVVLECTGVFTEKEQAELHLKAGAKRVIISAPSKGDNPAPTYVLGVNKTGEEEVFNNASCTTNCIAPMIKVLEESFGVEKAMMTTIHAYTQDQSLQDGPHKDLRRARSAAENIVPTTTGAAIAATEAIPSLKGRFDGIAIRVPVSVGSLSDITAVLKKTATKQEINKAFEKASQGKLKGIMEATNDPIVSSDIVGSEASVIVDLPLTQVVGGNLIKVFGWYDNEWGYSIRLVEQAIEISQI